MSNKDARQLSASTPPPHHAPSKLTKFLPKFLQKQSIRNRSKGLMDPSGSTGTSSIASESSAPTFPERTTALTKTPREGSKFLGIREEKTKRSSETPPDTNNTLNNIENDTTAEMDPPIIVEPVNIPRPRTSSERPAMSASELQPHAILYSSTSSASRIGDLPTGLFGWFASSSDLSLPLTPYQSSASLKSKASPLLAAAKHGKGHLDKAMRYHLGSAADISYM